MPRGDKSSYTDKQKRMAEHIEEAQWASDGTNLLVVRSVAGRSRISITSTPKRAACAL